MPVIMLFKDDFERFRFLFILKGNIMLTSKTFPSRQACLKSVNFFKTYSSIDSFYVKQNASCGSLYFTFNKGTNGEVLATSKSFLNEKNMGKIIMSIKASATSATIEDKIYKI